MKILENWKTEEKNGFLLKKTAQKSLTKVKKK